MKNIHHYSASKISSMPGQKQLKVILEMLTAIEQNISDRAETSNLIEHLLECLSWSESLFSDLPDANGLKQLARLNPSQSPHQIIAVITPILTKYQHRSNDKDFSLSRYDGAAKLSYLKFQNTLPVYAVLDNLRSAYNVGAIFRIAECFGLKALYLCGITPTPDNKKVKMTAMGTEQYVQWQYFPGTSEAVLQLKQQNIQILALETGENSLVLNEYLAQDPLAIVLGNEALGIDPEVLKLADHILSIPVFGKKNSLNVSTAFAIAAFSVTQKRIDL
jgi:23S rRNA (guanosine2251-2'-O)-methyltransferase